jgi:hypothetical protein
MQHNQYTKASEPQIVDPIIKLLEDVRLRRAKVTIPDADEMIGSLYNDPTIRKRILTEITIGNNSHNYAWPRRLPKLFQCLRSPHFPTAKQKIILDRLKKVPVYVVVNNAQEIIIASPRGNPDYNFFDWLSTKYHNACIWINDDGPVSLVFFFLNKEDATLYLQDIGKNDPKATEKTNLHVQLTSLDSFYKLNRTSSPGNQARLLPDLEEITNLVFDYLPKQLHSVNPQQNHTKTSYQGTPIYIIKPAVGKKGYKKSIIEYKITDRKGKIYTRNVFFKLEDAYLAWDKFCDDNKGIRLPLVPNLEVYNLENYLLELECLDRDVVDDNYFIGTQSSLNDLKQELNIIDNTEEPTLAKKVIQFINTSSQKLLMFSKGMLWVFTSDTLPTEDNAW